MGSHQAGCNRLLMVCCCFGGLLFTALLTITDLKQNPWFYIFVYHLWSVSWAVWTQLLSPILAICNIRGWRDDETDGRAWIQNLFLPEATSPHLWSLVRVCTTWVGSIRRFHPATLLPSLSCCTLLLKIPPFPNVMGPTDRPWPNCGSSGKRNATSICTQTNASLGVQGQE